MQAQRIHFLYLNLGHFLDHLCMLIFASVAALRLTEDWGMSYAELVPYATPGFIAFGLGAIPAGWIADKWSRSGMIAIFFIGIGISSIATGIAQTPLQIAVGLGFIGLFAAIYHPVGLAMVVHGRERTGIALAINGVFGNMGVACAALLTGLLIDNLGWPSAFYVPGLISICLGISYWVFTWRAKATISGTHTRNSDTPSAAENTATTTRRTRSILLRVFAIIFTTTALGGLIFQSTTFALPKIFVERLSEFAGSASEVGYYAFIVFALAAMAQLLVGYLIDRYSIRTVFAIVAASQATLFIIMTQVNGSAALLVAVAFMFVVFGQIPINDVLVGKMAHSEWRSRAYAMRYVITFSVMASAVPLIAWVQGNWGFDRLFQILSLAASAIFFATLLLPRSNRVFSAT